jgi:hypothetical protein
MGHTIRMMPPAYVKAYVADDADAEAICEAVMRPAMRFVPIKSSDEQAAGMALKTRNLLFVSAAKPPKLCANIWPKWGSWLRPG